MFVSAMGECPLTCGDNAADQEVRTGNVVVSDLELPECAPLIR